MNIFNFRNSYTELSDSLYTHIAPLKVKAPKLHIYNKPLGEKLGIKPQDLELYLSGNRLDDGSEPFAQAYGGHQFGQFNILGDGRAVILGEHITPTSERVDIQLKGSGRTPYSRRGDGKATLYSMLREYLISHAMDNLNIPTTLSLGVVETGETILRDSPERGGILTRVASSHIRVGTFQYVASLGDLEGLRRFTDYVINRHFPHITTNPYVSLLEAVMDRQIDLIINWLRVGFIHGVMNTDNVSICGETIDYGPCAFMDSYNPNTVFSSIDVNGRYAYKNQRIIGQWNIARFAECLVPLIDTDSEIALEKVNQIVSSYQPIFGERWDKMMACKLGLKTPDPELTEHLLTWMEKSGSDFTKTFRALESENFLDNVSKDEEIIDWHNLWLKQEPNRDLIRENNPSVIPRNHIVESVLKDASDRLNFEPFNNFLDVLENPYSNNQDNYYKNPPATFNPQYKTYCGT